MTLREYLKEVDVQKLAKNGIIPSNIIRDIEIYDCWERLTKEFDKRDERRQHVMYQIGSKNKISPRTVRYIVMTMKREIKE